MSVVTPYRMVADDLDARVLHGTGYTVDRAISSDRSFAAVKARAVIVNALTDEPYKWKPTRIARFIKRNHSTVYHLRKQYPPLTKSKRD